MRPNAVGRFAAQTGSARSWVPLGAVALVLVFVLAGELGPVRVAPVGPSAASSFPTSSGGPQAVAGGFPTPIHHVFVVMLENEKRSTVLQNGPFERYLQTRYAFASQYFSICHPSAPNYLALTSGAAWQCGSDGYTTYPTENLGNLAQKAGRSWYGFEESMPKPCDTVDAYPYAVKHNPFVYYSDIVGNATECAQHDVPFANWTSDVTAGRIPDFGMFTPNLTNDGHDTGAAYGDRWLHDWLTPLVNDSFFASSVFFVVYDESVNDGTGYNGTAGGNVYFSAVSPFARAGFNLTANTSHYNMLATVEWLLGLGNTGHNDSAAGFPPMKRLFRFPGEYAVTGNITAAATGLAIPGATVGLTGQANQTTGANGSYAFTVPNGTYGLSVIASGYRPAQSTVQVNGTSVVANVGLSRLSNTTTTYPVSGTVRAAANGSGISGATVSVSGGSTTSTDGSGRYTFQLPNGSYLLTASRDGYVNSEANVTVAGAGESANFSLRAIVPPAALRVHANASVGTVVVSESVTFTANGTGGTPPYTLTWTFGDGATGVGSPVVHAYSAAGSFRVTVQVGDSAGITNQSFLNVTVTPGGSGPPVQPAAAPPSLVGPAALAVVVGAVAIVSVAWLWHRRRGRIPPSSPAKHP